MLDLKTKGKMSRFKWEIEFQHAWIWNGQEKRAGLNGKSDISMLGFGTVRKNEQV
ncbi:MAG: hypothetical protein ACI4D7_01900 [Lachnospiraceae bacterium]